MDLLALRKLVEYTYRMLSTKQQTVMAALHKELAETGFEAKRISSNTLLWQIAYGVALKLILYGLVEQRFNLPTLSELSLSELVDAFREAYKASGFIGFKPSWIDYGFSLIEVSSLREPLRDAIATIKTHTMSDKLGQLYEEFMPQEERRRLGEFYTPKPIAEFMVRWALKRRDDYVLDPCVGSGTFLMEALHDLEALGSDAERAASQLYGVDINPLAVLMTTINILSRVSNAKPRIFLADFLNLNHLNMLSLGFERTVFDVIVCNPPYTRHHELSPSYKEEIARIIEAEIGEPLSRLSSIYLHFFIHAYQFLKDGGRLAFITPSEWMEADYGVVLKRFLIKKMHVESIVLFEEKALAFPDVLTRACITLASKEAPREYTSLIELYSWPSVSELIEAVEEGVERDYGWGRVKLCNLASIDPSTKWTPLFKVMTRRVMPHFMTKLGALANISRGIATGANEFFTLTEKEARSYGIEREYLKPVIAGARYLKGYDFTESDWELLQRRGKKVYLLWCFKQREELYGTSILNYIEKGERRGFNKRYLTRHRPIWYWIERRDVPDAFLIYMFRGRLRFVYNSANVYALNTLHCVYFDEKVKKEKSNVKTILAYLNSSLAFELARSILRMYGGGMYKLEPREAMEIPCIDPCKLSTDWREGLAALFDELCIAAKKDKAREDEVRREIDDEINRLFSST
jgi:type I restriction-modification system DNA methylase subunit